MAQNSGSTAAAEMYGLWTTGDLVVGDARSERRRLRVATSTDPGNPFAQNVSSAGSLTSTSASIGAQAGSSGLVEVIGSAIGRARAFWRRVEYRGQLALGGTNGELGARHSHARPVNPVTVGAESELWPGSIVMSENGILSVTGAANLDGMLRFIPIATPNPQLGNEFQILSATSGVAGTFSSTELPILDPGLAWAVNYRATSVSIEVVAGLLGDYNQNNIVDAADYTLWRNHSGRKLHAHQRKPGGRNARCGEQKISLLENPLRQLARQRPVSTQCHRTQPTTLVLLILPATGWSVRRGRAARTVPSTH